jgi:hypothetical protein
VPPWILCSLGWPEDPGRGGGVGSAYGDKLCVYMEDHGDTQDPFPGEGSSLPCWGLQTTCVNEELEPRDPGV